MNALLAFNLDSEWNWAVALPVLKGMLWTENFLIYHFGGVSSRCLQLPKVSHCLQSFCLCNTRTWPHLAQQRFPPSQHDPSCTKGTTAGKNICTSVHLLVRKCVPGKTKVYDAWLFVALFFLSIFWRLFGVPLTANCSFWQNFPEGFKPFKSLSGCTWKSLKSCWGSGGRLADRSLNVLFLVLPFLEAFCGYTKGHRDSQESQLSVPFQLPKAPFPFVLHSCAQTCS